MTKIKIKKSRGFISGKYELHMRGHADYCTGNDTVCAALSVLFFSLANYLDALGAEPCVEYIPGEASIACRGGIKVRLAFEFVSFAFAMLEERFPDNVRVW